MQNKNPVKQGHEINILFYRVLFTGSILTDDKLLLVGKVLKVLLIILVFPILVVFELVKVQK